MEPEPLKSRLARRIAAAMGLPITDPAVVSAVDGVIQDILEAVRARFGDDLGLGWIRT